MSLTRDQQQVVANHLRSRAQPPKCPLCDASNMKVLAEVTLHPTADADTPGEPRINVVCKYCGHVLHFAPSTIGLSVD